MPSSAIEACLAKPVIPVTWDEPDHHDLLADAATVILQGGSLAELPRVLEQFATPSLKHLPLLVHVDLLAGLENNEAGLQCLADMPRVRGVVTIHHQLTRAARRLGLLSIVRLFLTDSRALGRGLAIAEKSQADAIEIMPAAIAPATAEDFRRCRLPRIAGGLCRTEEQFHEVFAAGVRAVTSTRPDLWQLNRTVSVQE